MDGDPHDGSVSDGTEATVLRMNLTHGIIERIQSCNSAMPISWAALIYRKM
jgi:hypothetical protein